MGITILGVNLEIYISKFFQMCMPVYLSFAKLRIYHKEVFKLMCKDVICGELLGYVFSFVLCIVFQVFWINLDILIKDK